MLRLIPRTLTVCVAILALSACGDDITPPTAPSTPTVVTETFAGTVTRNGAQTHSFATSASGEVRATLTTLGAEEGTKIGLALGAWNGSSCAIVIAKDDAVQANVVIGQVSALGQLCVRIYDVGALTQSANYEITVAHP